MDNEKLALELEEKKRQGLIMKKKIIAAVIAVAFISVLMFVAVVLINIGWFTEEVEPYPEWYEFAPITDFDYNVMEDDWYENQLDIGPIVRFENAQTGVGIELTEEEYDDHGKAVKLLTGLIIAAQQGDNDAYNACFSDAYLIAEGKKKAEADGVTYTDAEYLELGKKSEFTMQQVYDVVITRYSEEKTADELLSCTYELKYKIHMNNGTLRNDMGSDCYREQQIIMLENKESGELEIITVNTFSDNVTQYRPIIWRIVLVAVVMVLAVAAALTVTVIYTKKLKNTETGDRK